MAGLCRALKKIAPPSGCPSGSAPLRLRDSRRAAIKQNLFYRRIVALPLNVIIIIMNQPAYQSCEKNTKIGTWLRREPISHMHIAPTNGLSGPLKVNAVLIPLFLPNVPSDLSLLAFGIPPAREVDQQEVSRRDRD